MQQSLNITPPPLPHTQPPPSSLHNTNPNTSIDKDSEAFLEYIRERVKICTYGVSIKMLKYEKFHTIKTR